jgi:myo-inositol-1(or 4)-monophosphatase
MTRGGRDDLSLIVEAAYAAGELATAMRNAGLETRMKVGDSPVTNADLACDALLTELLRGARPDYGWLSEETADDPDRLTRRRVFVVDPIDGTRDFLRGRPGWAVSIAVVEDGLAIAGAVYAPQMGEAYAAVAGGGATLDGAPIRCSVTKMLEGAGMCLVAAGAFDGTIAVTAKHDWDLAAADLIAREAGAVCGDHLGQTFRFNGPIPQQRSLVCAAPGVAPLILERLRHIGVPPSAAPIE